MSIGTWVAVVIAAGLIGIFVLAELGKNYDPVEAIKESCERTYKSEREQNTCRIQLMGEYAAKANKGRMDRSRSGAGL